MVFACGGGDTAAIGLRCFEFSHKIRIRFWTFLGWALLYDLGILDPQVFWTLSLKMCLGFVSS